MEPFPDCPVPKLERGLYHQWGWGLRRPGLTGGRTPEGLSRWDYCQEVRMIDAYFAAEQNELVHG